MSCSCNHCCPDVNNGGDGNGGTCMVCGPFAFGPQSPDSLEVWSTSNGAFVPGTVIVKLTDGDNNAQVQATVTTPGGPVTFPVPPITLGNSYAETFPAISDLTITKTGGQNAIGEFCVCVGQISQP